MDLDRSPASLQEVYKKVSQRTGFLEFKLQIKDDLLDFVTLDEIHFTSFRPFDMIQQLQNFGPQPTTERPFLELKLVNISDEQISKLNASSIVYDHPEQNSDSDQPDDEQPKSSSEVDCHPICAPHPVRLNKKSGIVFTTDINMTLRDDYQDQPTKKKSGKKKVSLVRIQGDKSHLKGKAKQQSILPKIRVAKRLVPKTSKLNLKFFLAEEICENGVRTLYHHSTHEFFEKENNKTINLGQINKNTPRKTSVDIPFNTKMLNAKGAKIELRPKVVIHAKLHSNENKRLLCQLEDQYQNDMNYTVTRVIIVPDYDGNLQWDELALSAATVFCKGKDQIPTIDAIDEFGDKIERIPKLEPRKADKNTKTKSMCNSTADKTTIPGECASREIITNGSNEMAECELANDYAREESVSPTRNLLHDISGLNTPSTVLYLVQTTTPNLQNPSPALHNWPVDTADGREIVYTMDGNSPIVINFDELFPDLGYQESSLNLFQSNSEMTQQFLDNLNPDRDKEGTKTTPPMSEPEPPDK
ncbi:unnamed protein product [Adineta ricciae]|uniref:Uncharacterized protein n=2 Tax=Adineta ricciae TaxID=249248 RepID=A0A815IZL7_ADIRI|nr:unnamed protein product [Adineta ricciae]